MAKRKAATEKETKKNTPNKKTKKTEQEKISKRKTIDIDENEDEIDEIVVTKKTRSGKSLVVEDDKSVKDSKPVKQAPRNSRKAKEITVEMDPIPVIEKKTSVKKTNSTSKNVENDNIPSPIIKKVSIELSKQPVLKKNSSESSKTTTTKKVVFEGSATIAGKDYNADGEVFQQVEQMWTVFDIVVLISLLFNALILLGSKYTPEFTKYLNLHVNYESFEDGFMQYIKLVMWSFPTVVSLYTTIVLPFILIEKGVSKVFGFKHNTTIRVYLLLTIILGSIIYYFDPELEYILKLVQVSPIVRKNLRGISTVEKSAAVISNLVTTTGSAVVNVLTNPINAVQASIKILARSQDSIKKTIQRMFVEGEIMDH